MTAPPWRWPQDRHRGRDTGDRAGRSNRDCTMLGARDLGRWKPYSPLNGLAGHAWGALTAGREGWHGGDVGVGARRRGSVGFSRTAGRNEAGEDTRRQGRAKSAASWTPQGLGRCRVGGRMQGGPHSHQGTEGQEALDSAPILKMVTFREMMCPSTVTRGSGGTAV